MERRSFATDPAATSAPPGPGRVTIEDLRPGFDGPAIVCDNLVKIYTVAGLDVVALQGLDLRVEVGELMAIVGASGSGKSTLMNILGGLDSPSAGRAVVAGIDLGRMNEGQRAGYRRRVVSFVWQQTERNHLPYLSAIRNVELPMMLDGVGAGERALRAAELLDLVGVDPQRRHLRPGGLSGGEQQRVAVAIALANRPSVLLADEPTGRLDTASAAELFAALRRVNRETGTSIVLVTHDPLVADHVQRTVAIRDGRTSTETLRRAGANRNAPDELTSEEFAVLDAAGRLQLPRAHVEALELRRRVRLRLEHDHIGVWPDEPGAGHDRPGPRPLGEPERADAQDPHDADGSQGAR
jgi:ABC-type lipoprotein export system ATPase subunit